MKSKSYNNLLSALALFTCTFSPLASSASSIKNEARPIDSAWGRVSIGPTLGINAPATDLNSIGGSITILKAIEQTGFAVGLETGYWLYGETQTSLYTNSENGPTTITEQKEISIGTLPILALAQYDFSSTENTAYIGFGLGLALMNAQQSTLSETESGSTNRFMILLKPGMRFSSFFVESRFGMIGNSLAILPTIGFTTKL
jgi:hypothetical protein